MNNNLQQFLKIKYRRKIPESATQTRLEDCKNESWKFVLGCENQHRTNIIGHCFVRYCSNCYESKKARAFKRLDVYKKSFPREVVHLIFTLPYQEFSKSVKKELEDAKRKFFQMFRRKKLNLKALSVFDYGHPKGDDPLEANPHIHAATNMRFVNYGSCEAFCFYQNRVCPNANVNCMWRKATGNINAVIRVATNDNRPKVSRAAVLNYLSRRIAGEFGHGKELIFFEDLGMSVNQYDNYVRGSRVFTVNFPGGICSRLSADLSQRLCKCGSKLHMMAIFYKGNTIFAELEYVPEVET